jgi:hypothetical protein
MRDSVLIPGTIDLDSRQQRFAARVASACEGWKGKETYNHPMSVVPIHRVIKKEHEQG